MIENVMIKFSYFNLATVIKKGDSTKNGCKLLVFDSPLKSINMLKPMFTSFIVVDGLCLNLFWWQIQSGLYQVTQLFKVLHLFGFILVNQPFINTGIHQANSQLFLCNTVNYFV